MSEHEKVSVGSLPSTTTGFTVDVRGATVHVRHEERDDIAFLANNAENWSLEGASLTQTAVEPGAGGGDSIGSVYNISGVSIIGDVNMSGMSECYIGGVRVDANEQGLFCNGKKQKDDPAGTKLSAITRLLASNSSTISVNGRKIEVIDGVVYHNGVKQVDDAEEPTPGAEAETAEEPPKPKMSDRLDIVVPYGYAGGLTINQGGTRELCFDDEWVGGTLSIKLSDRAELSAEANFRDVGDFTLKCGGSGTVSLKDVACDAGSIALSDRVGCEIGDLRVGAKGESFRFQHDSSESATIGSVALGCSGLVNLTNRGGVTLGPVTAPGFNLVSEGSGDAETGPITTTGEFASRQTGRGTLETGHVVAGKASIYVDGSGGAEFDGIECGNLITKQTDRGTLSLGKVKAGVFEFTQTGSGGASADDVACERFIGKKSDRGELSTECVTVAGLFDLEQTGSGDSTFEDLKCGTFKVTNTDRGSASFESVKTDELTISNSGSGSVTVDGGSCNRGSVTNTDRGDVSLEGAFKSVSQRNTGRGSINIDD